MGQTASMLAKGWLRYKDLAMTMTLNTDTMTCCCCCSGTWAFA